MTVVSNPMTNVLIRRKWRHTETHTGPRPRDDGAEIGVMQLPAKNIQGFWEQGRKSQGRLLP